MRRIAFLVLFLSFASSGVAQTKAPIKVEHFPALPRMSSPVNERKGESLVPAIIEVMPFAAPLVFETSEITNTLVLANAASVKTSATITLYSVNGKTNSCPTRDEPEGGL
jgi:hypothetical protein